MKRRHLLGFATAIGAACLALTSHTHLRADTPASQSGNTSGRTPSVDTKAVSLSDLFKPGVVFQDRNRDGVVDFVDARIVLANHPSAGELAAATDIAARLGFETSAMDLPIVRPKPSTTNTLKPDAPAIYVGAGALTGSGTTVAQIGGANLSRVLKK